MQLEVHCQRCTACCRCPGDVCVDQAEISKLAALKNMSDLEFIAQYTRLRFDRRGLSLKEKEDGSCIFLEGSNCTVQAAKPEQCKDFPNGWVNRLWGKLPLDAMRSGYPMLFNCAGFKKFLKENDV